MPHSYGFVYLFIGFYQFTDTVKMPIYINSMAVKYVFYTNLIFFTERCYTQDRGHYAKNFKVNFSSKAWTSIKSMDNYQTNDMI